MKSYADTDVLEIDDRAHVYELRCVREQWGYPGLEHGNLNVLQSKQLRGIGYAIMMRESSRTSWSGIGYASTTNPSYHIGYWVRYDKVNTDAVKSFHRLYPEDMVMVRLYEVTYSREHQGEAKRIALGLWAALDSKELIAEYIRGDMPND